MYKKFDLIQVDNHLYMVDKEAKIKVTQPYQIVVEKLTTGKYMGMTIHNENDIDVDNQSLIIATNNPALHCSGIKVEGASCSKNNLCTYPKCDGLPKLPEVEDQTMKAWVDQTIMALKLPQGSENVTQILTNLYKANPNKYSEEDMRKAMKRVFGIVYKNNLLIKEDCKRIEDDLLNDFSPIPKQVEVEIEDSKVVQEHNFDGTEQGEITWEKQLKLDSNNQVIVKQWIYEQNT